MSESVLEMLERLEKIARAAERADEPKCTCGFDDPYDTGMFEHWLDCPWLRRKPARELREASDE